MKRIVPMSLVAIIVITSVWAGLSTSTSDESSLSRYFPTGSLVYLEAKDLSALLAAWNGSPQKREWIEGSNYEVFSRSRLLLRLKAASDQFGAAAGFPPDVNFLTQVSGTRSALAIYDIGNLQFLYVTTLPWARSAQTLLWQTRTKFEPRVVAGATFYVRRDPDAKREVAFAVSGDHLLLATRQDLIAGALQLIAGGKDLALTGETWWNAAVKSTGAAGDLRMVLNLGKIVPSPYFRTYWVQQNITELKQYAAAVSDLYRSGLEFREERVLVRKSSTSGGTDVGSSLTGASNTNASPAAGKASDLVRLVPDDAGIYKAEMNPSVESCVDLLRSKLLEATPPIAPASKTAPQVQLGTGETGSWSDLETRIDQPIAESSIVHSDLSALRRLLEQNRVTSSLTIQSTALIRSGVFVEMRSAVVLEGASPWNAEEAGSALVHAVRPELTAGQLGLAWIAKPGYRELNGLWPLFFSVSGPTLIVTNDETLMQQLQSNVARKAAEDPASLRAEFRHAQELGNFAALSRVIDRPFGPVDRARPSQDPQFFSDNISSLSSALSDIASVKVRIRNDGEVVRQTITYTWSK